MNTLRHDRNTLAHITHTQLLKAVLESINTHQFFYARDTYLRISIDTIVEDVYQKITNQKFVSPILTNATGMRAATVHFNDKTGKEFTQLITQIQRAIQGQFEKEMEHQKYRPQTYLQKGLASLQDLQKQARASQNKISLSYSFWSQDALQSKKLHLARTPKEAPSALFRLSRATLQISDINTIPLQVSQRLEDLCHIERCMKESRGQTDVAEELHDDLMELLSTSLQDPSSEFVSLERFLQDETVGQFKKRASFCALRFFYAQYTTNHINLGEPYKQRWQKLEHLITRLQLLEDFIWKSASNENFYDGEYQQLRFNFRELYAHADSLYKLPIIPLMDGSLGETASRDQGVNSFHFGIKLKMGGSVSARKQIPTGMEKETLFDVFNYQLNLLDSHNHAHQTGMKSKKAQSYVEKIMTVLLTYLFVFKEGGTAFDPQAYFITHVLPIFNQPDQEKKKQFLATFTAELRRLPYAKEMVTDLQILFRALLKQKHHLFLPPSYDFDLRIRNGLLEQKLSKIQDSRSFFQPKVFEGKNKKALKYITIEPNSVKADALCKLNGFCPKPRVNQLRVHG